ncbi:hypothetical protein ACF090_23670 [Streptomyces sp. NPDC014892]|uniref:hypothetical protein n=1 Tax=Streptomyces TaxID=1883 RepID=UPI001EFAB023|nr:hypothetical protein [Streptomyces deccanensis]ULR54234.1 hypothetical protein L3078_35875 [Streptomyces deccanensis]
MELLLVLVLAVGGLLLLGRLLGWGRDGHLTDQRRAELLERLQASVRRDWAAEADKRGLTPDPRRPRLLHTQWAPAPPRLSDGRTRGLTGSTADMAGLVESFTALAPQRLVVIGPAGSGKSTLLLLFLLELCRVREQNPSAAGAVDPVPVLFSLSSYDPRRYELLDWLAGRLAAEYPEVGSAGSARDLLRTGHVLPCLDGLDEIPRQRLVRVLGRIRRAFSGDLPVILACRTEAYERALSGGPVLYGASVTEARELAFPHVMAYLRDSLGRGGPGREQWADLFDRLEHGWGVLEDEVRAARARGAPLNGPSWSLLTPGAAAEQVAAVQVGRRWAVQVEAAALTGWAREASPQLLAALGEALASPLTATLFTDLYSHADTDEETPFVRLLRADPAEVHTTILDNAVRVLFDHRLAPDVWPEARRHLSFLAHHLERRDRTDLAWWELSGALHHAVYGLLLGLLAAVAGGVATASAVDAGTGALAALQLGVAGLVGGMLLSWWGPDRVAAWLDRSLHALAASAKSAPDEPGSGPAEPRFGRTSTALAVGVPMGGAIGFLAALTEGPAVGFLVAIIFGLIVGVPAGLLGAGGPVRGPRWFRRGTGFLRRIGGGTAIGLGAGAVLGLMYWASIRATSSPASSKWEQLNRPTYVLAAMLAFALPGLVLGALSGFLKWLQAPAPADDATSPRILLRGDRRLVAGWGLVIAGLFGLGTAWVMATFPDAPGQVVEGTVLFVVLTLWVPIAVRTWPRYLVARAWLWLRGDLPRDLMGFLEHAHRVSALRQVGGVYQFRHKDVQEHLSRVYADARTRP